MFGFDGKVFFCCEEVYGTTMLSWDKGSQVSGPSLKSTFLTLGRDLFYVCRDPIAPSERTLQRFRNVLFKLGRETWLPLSHEHCLCHIAVREIFSVWRNTFPLLRLGRDFFFVCRDPIAPSVSERTFRRECLSCGEQQQGQNHFLPQRPLPI